MDAGRWLLQGPGMCVLAAVLPLAAAALLGGSGCQRTSPPKPGTPSGSSASTSQTGAAVPALTIAVIPKGTTHEFWKSVQTGALAAGKELGVQVDWKGPLKEDDRTQQIATVESFIVRKVSGIALAPLDANALRPAFEAAKAADIPVLIFDSALNSDGTVSFVATDNRRAGQMAGEHLAKLLGGKGTVLMMRYQQGSASTTDREEGFLEALRAAGAFTIVGQDRYAGATAGEAQKSAEDLIAATKDFDGVFTPNESSTFGMLRALRDSGKLSRVKVVGFDTSAGLVAALKAGEIHALVAQNPRKMGYLAVTTLVKHLRGETVEPRIDTGAMLITPDNLSTPEVVELLGL